MWKNLHKELNENKVENLSYDYSLSFGILNTSLKPFINSLILESDYKTFQKPIKKYNINKVKSIKQTYIEFMKKKIKDRQEKSFSNQFDI